MRIPVADLDPDRVFELIREFSRYPELTDAVEKVVVNDPDPDGSVVSEWLVHFRKGLLNWTERDYFFPEQREIRFAQISGDFDVFEGQWHVDPDGSGCAVRFDASFDLGIPTLAELLDPVAEAALRSNILRILGGLLGVGDALADTSSPTEPEE
jgi:ribosome-associated toxin RatA of RatAB toxin-antitoxin module